MTARQITPQKKLGGTDSGLLRQHAKYMYTRQPCGLKKSRSSILQIQCPYGKIHISRRSMTPSTFLSSTLHCSHLVSRLLDCLQSGWKTAQVSPCHSCLRPAKTAFAFLSSNRKDHIEASLRDTSKDCGLSLDGPGRNKRSGVVPEYPTWRRGSRAYWPKQQTIPETPAIHFAQRRWINSYFCVARHTRRRSDAFAGVDARSHC